MISQERLEGIKKSIKNATEEGRLSSNGNLWEAYLKMQRNSKSKEEK